MPRKTGKGMPDAEEREKEQEAFWGTWSLSSQACKMGTLVIIRKGCV